MVLKDTASCATAGSLNMDGGWVRRPSDDPENKTKQTNKQTNKKNTIKVLYKIPTLLWASILVFFGYPAPPSERSPLRLTNRSTFPFLLQFGLRNTICEDKERRYIW